MSHYRLLLDRTGQVLVDRARGFRNLIVAVVAVILGAPIGALVSLSPRPLAGLLLLPPLYAVFLWYDHRTLAVWRQGLAAAWQRRGIDLCAFRQALGANRALPPSTVQGMLDTLPVAGTLAAEQGLSAGTRAAVAEAMALRDAQRTRSLACAAAGLSGVALAMVLALLAGTPLPLLAGALVPGLALACAWSRRRRLARAIGRLRGLLGASDCNLVQYRECLAALDWGAEAPQHKERLLDLRP